MTRMALIISIALWLLIALLVQQIYTLHKAEARLDAQEKQMIEAGIVPASLDIGGHHGN